MRITITPSALDHSITPVEIRTVVEYPEHRVPLVARRPSARLVLAIGAYDANEPYIEVIYDVISRDEFEVFHGMMLRRSTIKAAKIGYLLDPHRIASGQRPQL